MIDNSPPVACSLDAAEMAQRGAEIRALGRDGLVSVERGERRVTLRFRPDTALRRRVEGIAAAESRCCGFLDFDLAVEEDATVLAIEAPEGGEPTLHELADLFAAEAGQARH
jgi:hypothetical protein